MGSSSSDHGIYVFRKHLFALRTPSIPLEIPLRHPFNSVDPTIRYFILYFVYRHLFPYPLLSMTPRGPSEREYHLQAYHEIQALKD